MVNNEAGAFLNITPDVLKKLDSFDEKLEMIEEHAHTAADALKNGFGSVVMDTSKLESVITSLAKKIDAIKGNPFEGAGKGAEETTRKTTSLNESLSRAADLLNRIGNNKIGEGSFANFNISGLKQGYSDLKKYVENMDLSKPQQKAAVEAMRYMKMELDEQRKTDEQRAQSAEKAAQRKAAADKRAAKEAADLANAQRSTPQGALDYSKNAKSLQQNVQAIEYLKKARLSLNTTDANYKSMLEQINQAIAKHNQALTEAGVKSQQLATRHRNLMDTAGQLSRQLALLFSVSQIEGYISKLAKVRGEFELQQRSLQAILQNKSQADQIFNKTVQLAVKSPFQIKELVTFTKQLAAYRIESDKLYDTTKRLADVSAGLGVDMGRLILAYGQVKAAAYLRGTEVRQFTEAGINLYGELQRYFQEVKGEAYTTAQIVDMISKRKVTFEDIENIFKRLTDSGGLFYNMQEIQAETLQGKISNLKDSIDVMLNSIGKANEDTLKGSIDAVKVLIDNWETVVNVAKALAPIFASMAITSWAKRVTGASSAMGIFARSIVNTGNAVKAFGATFAASWPLMAITAAIGIVTELISTVREYNKAIAESTNKYFEAKIRISTIQDESKSDIKKALDKLVQEMNNEGFEIKIKTGISEEEAKDEFNRYLKDYEIFLNEQKLMEARYARNKAKWFVDDIDEDSKDYASSVGEFILQGEELKTVMMQLATEENKLSSEHKKTLEQLAKGPKEGEDVLSYTKRMKDEIAKMWPALNQAFNNMRTGNGAYTKEAMEARASLTELFNLSKKYISDEKEMISELEDKFGKFDKNMDEAAKRRLRIRIDKSELDTVTKELAYKHYKLNVEVDKEETKQQIDWVKKEIKDSLDGTKINLDLGINENFLDGLFKELDTAQKYLKNVDKYKSLVSGGRQGKIYWGDVKEDSQFADWYKNVWRKDNELVKRGIIKDTMEISDFTIKAYIDAQEKIARAELKAYNQEVEADKKKFGSKAERDIWAERISVLKEMQARYEKLNQLMGENRAIEETRSAFKGALDFTQMGEVIKAEDIIPTKQGMIDVLEKLLEQIPNDVKNAAKRTGLEKEIAKLKIGIQQDYLKEQLDKTKQNIESMFNSLDLHKKLKDAGLSEAEVQQLFPGLAKTLDDVQRSIDIEFQTKYADTYKDPNTQQYKDYQDAIKEIDQQRIKEQQDTAERLIKSYKAQLSEQLQLDEQYYKDLEEIRDKFQNTPDLQKRLEENATKMYNQKSANNAWKEFTSSDSYLNLFDNIEYYSTAALQSMKDKLVKMREELKDLSPTELKQIMEQEKKLDKQLNQRDPWNKLIKSLKEYTKLRKENAKNEKDEAKARDLQAKYEKQLRTQSKIVAEKKAAYESATENIDAALEEYEVEKNNYDLLVDKKKEQDKIIAGYDAANRALSQQAQKLQGIIQSLGKIDLGGGMVESISGITNSVSDFAHMLEDSFGVAIGEDLYEILDGVGALFGSLESFDITKPISSSLNVLTGLGKTIGSIFGIGNKNKKKEREIQRQIKNIESLGRAYDELKEKMEAAWSADDLRTQTKDTIANLDQQIESYENMINSEEAKKDSDRGRIDEWNDAINELKKTRQEILDQQKLELGGIGGESEYKDAASSFVQAWMDAFNETEDGLKALNENFDSFIENLIVKQATMRLAQGRLKELFEKIDESVTEGSVGGINLTKEELANIQALGESALKGLNEDLLALMETLGYKGTSVGQKSELSALQQGIQAMSEETAGELQALLNSIRWFVSQQTTDVTAIRNILESEYLSSGDGSSNPMLIELKSQTEYLKLMSDNFESILSYSGNSKGRGIRVFMQ